MHLADGIQIIRGLTGGVIIGLSSSALLYLTGISTGCSGVVESSLLSTGPPRRGAFSYLIGLLSSGAVLVHFLPDGFSNEGSLSSKTMELILSGLFVGFGTRMGSGCTSGHGVCGLSRLSPRSTVAVLSFMGTGALGAYLSHETVLPALISAEGNVLLTMLSSKIPSSVSFLTTVSAMLALSYGKDAFDIISGKKKLIIDKYIIIDHIASFLSAFTFGLGLVISGMCSPNRVTGFLNFSGSAGWDPTLAGVMGGAVLVNLLINYSIISSPRIDRQLLLSRENKKVSDMISFGLTEPNLKIDRSLVLGSAIFGLGWGLAGVCPGPAIVSLGAGVSSSIVFVPAMVLGMKLYRTFFS